MIQDILIALGLVFIFADLLVKLATLAEAKKREQRLKVTLDSVLKTPVISNDTQFAEMRSEFEKLRKELQDNWDEVDVAENIFDGKSPLEKVRVYAVVIQKGLETRLFMNPSESFEAMSDATAKKYGPGWVIIASAHLDVDAPLAKIPVAEPKQTAEKGVNEYVSILKFAQEKFASTKTQKTALDGVINNVQKHYGSSRAKN